LGDIDKLNPVDYFMVRIVNIPDFNLWIKMIITKGKMEGLCSISGNLQNISEACEMIMSDKSFHNFLRFVLHVGLFLNKVCIINVREYPHSEWTRLCYIQKFPYSGSKCYKN
jgi:hypothetical protein